VRANTGFEDDFFQSGAIGRRSARVAATASKRVLKGWGAGVVAGFASSMTPGFPDDDGAVGFLGRLTMSTVSGAAWGGAPGAVAGALTTSISEIIKGLSSTDKRVEALRESMAEWRSELGKFIRDAENEMVTLRGQLEQKLREEIDAIAHKTLWQYREERFQNSNLVN
jgi:vacuolar-type H+-ATPase subunit H